MAIYAISAALTAESYGHCSHHENSEATHGNDIAIGRALKEMTSAHTVCKIISIILSSPKEVCLRVTLHSSVLKT